MGYTTDFSGTIEINPPLSAEEVTFLKKFSETRRMGREQGPYFVDGEGFDGPGVSEGVTCPNTPPEGQPGLWCNWAANEDGSELEWNGMEKFYHPEEWMVYLIQHFIGPEPLAKKELPFLQGHKLSGEILAQGEDITDRWLLHVGDSVVSTETLR